MASRHDSFSEEGEDYEAELTAVLSRAGVAGNDGHVRGWRRPDSVQR